jgi:predicted porin
LKQPKLSSAASTTEINASYNMGFARVAFGNVKTEDVKATNAFGVSVPMGAITLGAGHIKSATKKYTDYSVAYSLSKRTTARASFGKPDAAKRSQSRFNIVHTF